VSAFADWLRGFRELHERARQRSLNAGEEETYLAMREELARAMLAAQRLSLKPGETPRRALRVARALQLDLELGAINQRTVTLDLSTGGFSTLLAKPPGLGEEVKISMRLPASEPLTCRARITEVKPLAGSARVSAQFLELPAADLERLEFYIVDAVLALLAG
jgi:hypothetical protein